jgi:hypothetical protein
MKPSYHNYSRIRFSAGVENIEVIVNHSKDEVNLVEIYIEKPSMKASDEIKMMLLTRFPGIRCRILLK